MKTVGTPELSAMLNRGERLVMVNTLAPNKYRVTHIPGSINIPLDAPDFADRVAASVGGKEFPVVVYCSDSSCDSSSKAAAELEAAGFTDVYDYTGGAKAWKAAGGILAPTTAEMP